MPLKSYQSAALWYWETSFRYPVAQFPSFWCFLVDLYKSFWVGLASAAIFTSVAWYSCQILFLGFLVDHWIVCICDLTTRHDSFSFWGVIGAYYGNWYLTQFLHFWYYMNFWGLLVQEMDGLWELNKPLCSIAPYSYRMRDFSFWLANPNCPLWTCT